MDAYQTWSLHGQADKGNPATPKNEEQSAAPAHARCELMKINFYGVPMKLKIAAGTPSLSHKDYAGADAVEMLRTVYGLGTKRHTLILSSSGNTARTIATYSAHLPMRFIIVADVLSPRDQIEPLRRFPHVHLVIVNEPDDRGSHIRARKRLIDKLKTELGDDAVELDQYSSTIFPLAYAKSFAPEIEAQAPNFSEIYVPTGTCGCILGLETYRRVHNRRWRIVPVDVPGSSLFEDGASRPGARVFSGIGNGVKTEFAKRLPPDMTPIYVEAVDAAKACRWLADRHYIRLGPSSGAAVAAFYLQMRAGAISHTGETIILCPDGGDAYAATLYDDQWLIERGLGKAILGP